MTKKTVSKQNNKKKTKPVSWMRRIWNKICNAAKWIWNGVCAFWKWLSSINVVALLNLALLSAIIVLFSMLIIDITKKHNVPVVIVPETNITSVQTETKSIQPETRHVKPRAVLPIKQNVASSQTIGAVRTVYTQPEPIITNNIPRKNNILFSDTIIDSRYTATVLKNGTQVNGNLYIQDMIKYTLPCNVKIKGNLFLRNVGMLQFCGDFTVTGNIYVSPRSSFGPLPKNARIGGHVIL